MKGHAKTDSSETKGKEKESVKIDHDLYHVV